MNVIDVVTENHPNGTVTKVFVIADKDGTHLLRQRDYFPSGNFFTHSDIRVEADSAFSASRALAKAGAY